MGIVKLTRVKETKRAVVGRQVFAQERLFWKPNLYGMPITV